MKLNNNWLIIFLLGNEIQTENKYKVKEDEEKNLEDESYERHELVPYLPL